MSKELENELKREIFKDSYYEFFKWAFKILYPNEKYEDSFHIKYLCDLLQEESERILQRKRKTKDVIINIPPRTSKSLLTSVCYLPWVWLKNPYATFICVSFDDELSMLNSQLSKDIIKSDEYQELFGDIYQIRKDADSKGYYANDKGGFRLSKTTGSNITGHKGLFVIVDDPQNPKTSESEVFRKAATVYYTNSLYNRLTPAQLGVRIIVMQRLHDEDLSGYLLKKDPNSYRHICLPAEVSDLVKPVHLKSLYSLDGLLDPIRLDKGTLLTFKSTLGSRGYSGQYGQTPSPEEGGIIKKTWFDIYKWDEVVRDPTNNVVHFFVDGAYTKNTENDPTGILACFRQNNVLYIIDVQIKYLEFPELCRFLIDYVKRLGSLNSKVFVEPKANGKSIVQQMRDQTMLNFVEAPNPELDKKSRAYSITAKLEARRVRLIDGMWIEETLKQWAAFPNAAHDEEVDLLVMAVKELLQDTNADFYFL